MGAGIVVGRPSHHKRFVSSFFQLDWAGDHGAQDLARVEDRAKASPP
jgi:hypothetical protein